MCPLENSIKSINSSDSISFCHGWIVKRSVNEVIYGIAFALLLHDRLADVNNLGGTFTETMNAQDFFSFAMKQDFQTSCLR